MQLLGFANFLEANVQNGRRGRHFSLRFQPDLMSLLRCKRQSENGSCSITHVATLFSTKGLGKLCVFAVTPPVLSVDSVSPARIRRN